MPRAAFNTSMLNAATPGMTKLAMALGGGGNAYETARDNEIALQSKIAQAMSAQQLNEAKTAEIDDARARATPESVRRNAMLGYGVPLADEAAVTRYFDTGELGGRYAKPGDDVGPVLPSPDWAKNLDSVRRTIMAATNALTLGDKNSANVAKATGDFREQALSDAIIAGTADRNTVGGAQAAIAGKPLFNADSTGAVLDQFSGGMDTGNDLAQSTIGLKNAQARAAGQKQAAGPKAPAGYRFTQSEDGESVLEPIPGGPKDPTTAPAQPAKPMPTAALKLQQEEVDAIASASGIQSDLKAFEQQIESGKLNLGVISNLMNQGRNLAGMSTEQSRNLASFKAMLEKLRNDSLRLNKGVQTDGDAQRAWNELITNINDPGVVTQRLKEIQALNDRAVMLRQQNIADIRANYNQAPMDVSGRTNLAPTVGGNQAGGGWSIKLKGQ